VNAPLPSQDDLPPIEAYEDDIARGRADVKFHVPAASPPNHRPPLDWPDLAGKEPPERRWAIRGWLGFGHITLLVGSGGIGKTLLAQQAASCLALGKSFVGDVQGPLKCLMWACEDDHDELWRRQVQIAKWCDAGLDAFAENLIIEPRHGLDNTLVATEFGKLVYSTLIEDLREQAADIGAEVVILDNVGQLFGGGENDRHAVTAFLNTLSGALPGRAILLLAHPSRSSGSEFSGSSAWENVARTRLYLGASLPGEKQESEPTDHVRYLARRKANYSPKDWRKLNYADGALTPEAAEEGGGVIASIRRGNAEKAIVAALPKLAAMGVTPTDSQSSKRFLPKAMHDYKMDDGHSKHDLAEAMRSLMLEARIRRAVIGRDDYRRPLYGLEIAS
jgi:hypothetical protein